MESRASEPKLGERNRAWDDRCKRTLANKAKTLLPQEMWDRTIPGNVAEVLADFARNRVDQLALTDSSRQKFLQAMESVPEDISVIGFDDLPAIMVVDPILTVAAQPAYEMGKQAAKLLLKRLSGQSPEGGQEIILPTEIIERQSSGPPI